MLTAIAFEGPRNINSVSSDLGIELVWKEVVEAGRPGGNTGGKGKRESQRQRGRGVDSPVIHLLAVT